ncbi:anthranilate synthase component I [Melioribacter roseus P3M-2]|uniref:Anthranilate synthase component 1 n=1 Tax=Melioribacter roseus (strain DSM 23840 / JCM 17771 / VKM B-2668 / P3M-2) TaxID=1191523 RepID=I6ZA45_MELRP|nr:anthranilate synthase component I [Melioribacter roseus]AFN76010.1 anthranilate synthase component I [Melioribacter roseus P3M-2]
MEYNKFLSLAEKYNTVPVYDRLAADLQTPVSAYLKLRKHSDSSFLLESVEGIGRLARYSFIGIDPEIIISNRHKKIKIEKPDKSEMIENNLFDYLQRSTERRDYPVIDELPYFTGGWVGYIGFDNISLIEDVIDYKDRNGHEFPDSILGFFRTIIVFDHFKHQLILINNSDCTDKTKLKNSYEVSINKLNKIKKILNEELNYKSDFKVIPKEFHKDEEEEFLNSVEKSKSNIYNGDVFQIVLSRRFEAEYSGDLFNVYRALRMINPSPYMYYISFGNDIKVAGTSPEDLLKVNDRKAEILPIAGTRRRGKNEEEDKKLEENLINDPKEIAEHVMLVDLARNDLGRVCKTGTVKISENMKINRFSHVMHIVSRVEGILKDGLDSIDALKAAFPAGTVSGAPKIRAIQLINQYEKLKRGLYAGSVGYIDFRGNLDMCIAIRTLWANNQSVFWQAGAGIVADSRPELELKEIKNKSAVLLSALKLAEVIDENIDNR